MRADAALVLLAALAIAGCSGAPTARSTIDYANESAKDVVLHLAVSSTTGSILWSHSAPLAAGASGHATVGSDASGTVTLQVATEDGRSEARTVETHGYAIRATVTSGGLTVVAARAT